MKVRRIWPANQPGSIRRAVSLLKKGGLVAFPTETVYGLGADALNAKAVCQIFSAKRRPSFDPLIVHVADPEEVFKFCRDVPKKAEALMKAFWPGPLTLVLKKKEVVPDVVTAGLPTVAVRMPKHETALALIRALRRPIAAPSANLFGRTSPTTAQAVMEGLGARVDLILDGGPCEVGVESTVIQLEGSSAVLLRPGGVTVEALRKFLTIRNNRSTFSQVLSPGLLKNHYAPQTPLLLMGSVSEKEFGKFDNFFDVYMRRHKKKLRLGLLAFGKKRGGRIFEAVQVLSGEKNLVQAASNLFEAMRKLDRMGLDLILAEPVSRSGMGLAIMDRLRKASGGRRMTPLFLKRVLESGEIP